LMRYVAQVVDVESPVHQGEVMRRIMEGAGVTRLGVRINSALETAIENAVRQGNIKRQGAFLWRKKIKAGPFVRNRESFPASAQKLEWVAPEEIALAVHTAVANAYGISAEEDVYRETLALFGFNRVTANRKKILHQVIEKMIKKGSLVWNGSFLMVNNNEDNR